MGLRFHEYKKQPWVVTWKNPWTGKKHTKSFCTEKEAATFERTQAELAAKEKALLRRARLKKQKAKRLRVGELLEAYFLNSEANDITRRQSQYHASHILAAFGKRDSALLDREDILNFSQAQQGRGIALTTIYRRVGILRAALNWGVRNGLLENNPLRDLRLPRSKSQRIAPPTPAEARAILSAAAPHVQRVVILGLFAGPRIGPSELFRLEWKDVDFSTAMLRMPCAAKNNREDGRDIPIRKGLIRLMRAWHQHDMSLGISYVISWGGRPLRSICRAWHTALTRAGIERRIRPYDLRHAFATYALAGSADIGSVASLMGHTDASMILRTYQHVQDAQKRAAVEAAPDLLSLAASGRTKPLPGI